MSNAIKTAKLKELLRIYRIGAMSFDKFQEKVFGIYSQFSSPAVSDEEIKDEALEMYCTPHGDPNPQTYAYINGFKSALKRGGETPVGEEEIDMNGVKSPSLDRLTKDFAVAIKGMQLLNAQCEKKDKIIANYKKFNAALEEAWTEPDSNTVQDKQDYIDSWNDEEQQKADRDENLDYLDQPQTPIPEKGEEDKWDRLAYHRGIYQLDMAALERYRIRLVAGMDKIEREELDKNNKNEM